MILSHQDLSNILPTKCLLKIAFSTIFLSKNAFSAKVGIILFPMESLAAQKGKFTKKENSFPDVLIWPPCKVTVKALI